MGMCLHGRALNHEADTFLSQRYHQALLWVLTPSSNSVRAATRTSLCEVASELVSVAFLVSTLRGKAQKKEAKHQ